jgi:hypothetical protein
MTVFNVHIEEAGDEGYVFHAQTPLGSDCVSHSSLARHRGALVVYQ